MDETLQPDAIQAERDAEPQSVSQPTKLIRIASMTRAMLDEVRQAPIDEGGKTRLAEVHARSLAEMREVLAPDLLEEFDEIMVPLSGDQVTEAEIRIAQAQLIGWLEGLFHGIQASLWSQQMAAQAQLAEMSKRAALERGEPDKRGPGPYL